jgi:hypothetical protein
MVNLLFIGKNSKRKMQNEKQKFKIKKIFNILNCYFTLFALHFYLPL